MPVDSSLFSQGVAVACLGWFMLRLEGILKESIRQQQLTTRALTLMIAMSPDASVGEKAAAEAIAKEANGGK